jgi:hypothetical protein
MYFSNKQPRPRQVLIALAICFCALVPVDRVHAGGPENLMLIINADSPSSKLLANHYIELRKIPTTNVVYLNGLPDKEITTLEVFREQILKPIVEAMKTRGLEGHIDYIVYSSDFPTSIKVPEHLKKLARFTKSKVPECRANCICRTLQLLQ